MTQQSVYSREWFKALDAIDRRFSAYIQKKIAVTKDDAICTICCGPARRDYAVLADRCLSPLRLCRVCHRLYRGTFGGAAVVPFLGGARCGDRDPGHIRIYHGKDIIFRYTPPQAEKRS